MALRKDKVTSYNNNDPRYGFTIMDSDEYNRSIPPFRIREVCQTRMRPNNFNFGTGSQIGANLVSDCSGQRYENCVPDPLENIDTKCETKFRLKVPTKRSVRSRNFTPKKLNINSFYSDTRVSRMHNPGLEIDYSPDTNNLVRSKPNSIVKKSQDPSDKYRDTDSQTRPDDFDELNELDRVERFDDNTTDSGDDEKDEIIEHCVGLGLVESSASCGPCNKLCKPVMTSCCPFCPSWMTPEDSCMLSLICCLLCICLPCIMSCIRNL
ncbi:hypothetical protein YASMINEVIRUS_1383 [Yasminevirus sp. GU-2018]|uniref:Uncharacterized protein n=1 Tax=Yasminevirus sp. GU-2018 TaxID=2420051 RepID=A0A5K0UB12_9VIRU|nr:hypothetical protein YASMINEVIRUS_1383 [Yasminevirus sp. GU-2018]